MILQRESSLEELMRMVNKCGSLCIDPQLSLCKGVCRNRFQETRQKSVRDHANNRSDQWSFALVPGGAWKAPLWSLIQRGLWVIKPLYIRSMVWVDPQSKTLRFFLLSLQS